MQLLRRRDAKKKRHPRLERRDRDINSLCKWGRLHLHGTGPADGWAPERSVGNTTVADRFGFYLTGRRPRRPTQKKKKKKKKRPFRCCATHTKRCAGGKITTTSTNKNAPLKRMPGLDTRPIPMSRFTKKNIKIIKKNTLRPPVKLRRGP